MIDAGPSISALAPKFTRDVRIDVLRGLALVMVWIDHFEAALGLQLASRVTLRVWGPSDAAELFVLLSGLVVGRSYAARLDRDGRGTTVRHCLRRTRDVYLGYCLASITLLLSGRILSGGSRLHILPQSLTDEHWLLALLQTLTLWNAPEPLRIVLLYLLLLLASPVLLWCLRRRPIGVLAASMALYASVQPVWWEGRAASQPWPPGWYFHPCGWQLLYAIGLAIGDRWQRTGVLWSAANRTSAGGRRWGLWCLAAAVLVVGWFVRPEATATSSWLLDVLPRPVRNITIELVHKGTLGPVRLVHGLTAAWLLLGVFSFSNRSGAHSLQWPLALCGRSSLACYLLGTVLLIPAVWLVTTYRATPWNVLLVEYDALLLLGSLTYLWSVWLGTKRR